MTGNHERSLATTKGIVDSVATLEHVDTDECGWLRGPMCLSALCEAASHVDTNECGWLLGQLADAEMRRTLAEEQGLSKDEIQAIDDEIAVILDARARRRFAAQEAERAETARKMDDARKRHEAARRKFNRVWLGVWLGSSLTTMLVVGTVSGDYNTGMEAAWSVLVFAPLALAGLAFVAWLVSVPFEIVDLWRWIRRRQKRQSETDA